jgi:hypothetical protein
VNDKISNMGLANESLTALHAQIEDLQPRHRANVASCDEILDQITMHQSQIRHEVITAVQSPFSSNTANISQESTLRDSSETEKFKTVEDVGAHIRQVCSIPLLICPKNTLLEILRCNCALVP